MLSSNSSTKRNFFNFNYYNLKNAHDYVGVFFIFISAYIIQAQQCSDMKRHSVCRTVLCHVLFF